MEENTELNMGLFDSAENLELNTEFEIPDMEEVQEDEQLQEEEINNDDISEDQNDGSEEVAEEDQEDEGEDQDLDESSSPTLYSSFASVLNEQGLLPSLDSDSLSNIKDVDGLTTAFKTEIDNQVKEYLLNKVGEEGYEALEKGVSLAQYQQHQSNVNDFESISDEDITSNQELGKQLIYQDLINQGLSEDRALRILKKTIDLGEDSIIEDAKESLSSLKVFEEKRLEQLKESNIAEQAKRQAHQTKIDNDLKNSIYNSKEFIEGIPTNKTIQDKVYNSITKIVSKDPNTGIAENKLMRDRREDPISFDSKLYYLYELTNGFSDFSKIVTKSESKATSQLEKHLRQNRFQESGQPAFLEDKESYDGLGSEIVI